MELSEKQLKKVLIIVLSVFIFLFFCWDFLYSTNDYFFQASFERKLNESYTGTVLKKDYDKLKNNRPTLYFSNGTSTSIYGGFWGAINRGDSISKTKGSYLIYIYRKDSIFTLDNEKAIKEIMKTKEVNFNESKIPR